MVTGKEEEEEEVEADEASEREVVRGDDERERKGERE